MCMGRTGMAISCVEEKICSVNTMEDDGGDNSSLTLLECLRGRLLAERQASRAAKDDAEFMVQKLTELEEKLREEIRLRDKAEKRLKFLRGKLETANIPFSPTLEESEESCRSPIASGPKDARLERAKRQISEQETSQDSKTDSSNHLKSSDHSDTHEAHLDWEIDDFPAEKSGQQITPSDEEFKIDDPSSPMLKASVAEPETRKGIDKQAPSLLAPVPIKLPAKPQPREMKITRKITSQALDPLIHARVKTRSSMERRHMFKALIC
ncbi:uncharacterized protein LOC104426515 isoform X2 [Eucalyptus grandis]|uniref:uncharacterized protein LOC104426515 isoform X2 n=1 Tax=Eucalyptus grandis TaxID=71139 RepID=UPI0005278EB0|nr:uncharacterized protein LOC104426515 isoform X2 [Eucalyptus grandis]XP_039160319.1 uncharacterized protein LOC104426515 isoform X2 [Eucalyptus grandis]